MKDFLLGQTSTKTTYTEFIFHFLCSCVSKHNARSSQKSHASQHIIWESLLQRTHLYIQCQLISYVWVLGPEKRGGIICTGYRLSIKNNSSKRATNYIIYIKVIFN